MIILYILVIVFVVCLLGLIATAKYDEEFEEIEEDAKHEK